MDQKPKKDAKLKLDLGELEVQSFEPSASYLSRPGTVHGQATEGYTFCNENTCHNAVGSCGAANTCDQGTTCDHAGNTCGCGGDTDGWCTTGCVTVGAANTCGHSDCEGGVTSCPLCTYWCPTVEMLCGPTMAPQYTCNPGDTYCYDTYNCCET